MAPRTKVVYEFAKSAMLQEIELGTEDISGRTLRGTRILSRTQVITVMNIFMSGGSSNYSRPWWRSSGCQRVTAHGHANASEIFGQTLLE